MKRLEALAGSGDLTGECGTCTCTCNGDSAHRSSEEAFRAHVLSPFLSEQRLSLGTPEATTRLPVGQSGTVWTPGRALSDQRLVNPTKKAGRQANGNASLLTALGGTHNESKRWQKFAAISADELEVVCRTAVGGVERDLKKRFSACTVPSLRRCLVRSMEEVVSVMGESLNRWLDEHGPVHDPGAQFEPYPTRGSSVGRTFRSNDRSTPPASRLPSPIATSADSAR